MTHRFANAFHATWRFLWSCMADWTPRVTPGIRAEVTLILSDGGQVGLYHSKLRPEDDPRVVYAMLLQRWLDALGALGLHMDYTTVDGQTFPLIRPPVPQGLSLPPVPDPVPQPTPAPRDPHDTFADHDQDHFHTAGPTPRTP